MLKYLESESNPRVLGEATDEDSAQEKGCGNLSLSQTLA